MTLDAFGGPSGRCAATSQSGMLARPCKPTTPGAIISTTDAEGNVKFRYYDHARHVIKESQAINADPRSIGINKQGSERRYAYDALGSLTDTLDVYLDGTELMQSGRAVVYDTFGEGL